MKQHWNEQELSEHWVLTTGELQHIRNRTVRNRIGFAATLKFFMLAGRFPLNKSEIPRIALEHLANQLDINPESISDYKFSGRSYERDRSQIREIVGFRPATQYDAIRLTTWMEKEIIPIDHRQDYLRDAALDWCRNNRIEPPATTRLDRVIGSAMNNFQNKLFSNAFESIPLPCRVAMDRLLESTDNGNNSSDIDRTLMAELRSDPGRPSLESVLTEIGKLNTVAAIGLPDHMFESISAKVLHKYRLRASTEPPRELRRHPEAIRYTLLAAFCYQRKKEIIGVTSPLVKYCKLSL